ncbi:hypothetical protein MASR2M29_23270 [Spirochaetota bacterium]
MLQYGLGPVNNQASTVPRQGVFNNEHKHAGSGQIKAVYAFCFVYPEGKKSKKNEFCLIMCKNFCTIAKYFAFFYSVYQY